MWGKLNQEQKRNLLGMEKRLSEIQKTKKLMIEYKEEVAAAKEVKKPWWKFWE